MHNDYSCALILIYPVKLKSNKYDVEAKVS